MRLTGKLGAVVAAAALSGLLATACGASSASAHPPVRTTADILREMQSAIKSAKSVHMTGSATSGSKKITFDMSFYGSSEMSGTLGEGSGMFSMLIVDGNAYIKANAAFLKLAHLPASACGSMCGKYIKLPASAAGQFTGLSMSALSKQAIDGMKMPSKGASSHFATASYNGQTVLKYSDGGHTVEVASTGTPYPVFVSAPGGDNVAFSQWNAVQAPVAPPASKILSTPQL